MIFEIIVLSISAICVTIILAVVCYNKFTRNRRNQVQAQQLAHAQQQGVFNQRALPVANIPNPSQSGAADPNYVNI